MYKYSLPMFLELFRKTLDAKQLGHAPAAERIRMLAPLLQQLVFGSVSRSLFKRDRLTYALHLIHMLHPQQFGKGEWELFTGNVIVAGTAAPPLPSWAQPERGPTFAALVHAMPSLAQQLQTDAGSWSRWGTSEKCEMEFPLSMPNNTTQFHKILLIQALRPERLDSALFAFVTTTLSIPSLSPASSSLEQACNHRRCPPPHPPPPHAHTNTPLPPISADLHRGLVVRLAYPDDHHRRSRPDTGTRGLCGARSSQPV